MAKKHKNAENTADDDTNTLGGARMTRQTYLALFLASVMLIPAAQAMAWPHLLPSIHLPRINGGKAIQALAYPVKKTVVNGGKTVLKVGAAADSVGLVPNIGPSPVSHAIKKTLWGFGK